MKTFLSAIMLFSSILGFAQTNNPAAKDTIIWTDSTIYSGTVIKQNRSTVQFKTDDGQMHLIATSAIAKLKLANAPPEPTEEKIQAEKEAQKAAKKEAKKAEIQRYYDSLDIRYEPRINWASPDIPPIVKRKHKAGVGLTATGATMLAGGLVMMIAGLATNGQTTTTTNGYSTQTNVNIGLVGGIGIAVVIVGLPLTIVGGVKLSRAEKAARLQVRLR
ncbi:MAG: hypothetical protein JWO03_1162 [Bacteroidetes bacterium]|nr:hypothetical protein [Bacteroidota bacterium]